MLHVPDGVLMQIANGDQKQFPVRRDHGAFQARDQIRLVPCRSDAGSASMTSLIRSPMLTLDRFGVVGGVELCHRQQLTDHPRGPIDGNDDLAQRCLANGAVARHHRDLRLRAQARQRRAKLVRRKRRDLPFMPHGVADFQEEMVERGPPRAGFRPEFCRFRPGSCRRRYGVQARAPAPARGEGRG